MVVLAKGELEQIALPAVQRAAPPLAAVPEVDLAMADRDGRAAAARAVARASEEHGFFKVTGHGVPAPLLARVEAAAAAFFALPQQEKDKAAGGPFGYASKRIGGNGDLGWVEYLLLGVTAAPAALPGGAPLSASPCCFRELLDEYVAAVRRMTCTVLELMAEGLGLDDDGVFARLVLDGDSDSMLRVNHYPPEPKEHGGARLTGFGEHTDPQLISVLRSNATAGLEISLRDGTWVSVPSDTESFFINVGDALQVLTNGRFRSVRHRVMVSSGSAPPRVSVIFFGGPPPRERLAPLPGLVDREGGRRRYRDFTWTEYKTSAYQTKLADDRLGYFETTPTAA
ncbi:Gibberellin 2-beta-dioxygenase 1 [Dichanthelium oligosanthes]|uniref:Gibberellin 2-beta-dioxygenase 1 n=1 Tax=Dichanthelium oligosanthes TaxID=888268 RepID=A0A1E5WAS5_9POAL|nr:Gibberellin 2-beta-dioxygenase 1 [Dichanthelium oligosanthes]